jgi:hypothetical protein
MSLTKQIAEHFKQVHFGGNWTAVNLKTTLADIDWQMATVKVHNLNAIATLVFHLNYYVSEVMLKVLQGLPINAHDKFSFDMPPIQSQEDWEKLLQKTWSDAEQFIALMEQLPDSKLEEVFITEKYGNYYRNLTGIIEHTHYHLGQIVIIKKIIAARL